MLPEGGKRQGLPHERGRVPQVHWELPQHSRTHKKLYAMRTQVERIISRVKRVLSFERFYNRGKKVLQGFIDRYVTVFNIIAFAAWAT